MHSDVPALEDENDETIIDVPFPVDAMKAMEAYSRKIISPHISSPRIVVAALLSPMIRHWKQTKPGMLMVKMLEIIQKTREQEKHLRVHNAFVWYSI